MSRRNCKYFIRFNSNPEDVEKAVTPTIVWTNTNHSSFVFMRQRGFIIMIGWWHFSISVGVNYPDSPAVSYFPDDDCELLNEMYQHEDEEI
jgi:hypothetical protein